MFVLGTGRCGTVTFIRACEHLDNYTAGHETRARLVGSERFAYPGDHIEADNRLAWFLGGLGQAFDDRSTLYVHLRRDPDDVAASFMRRWDTASKASIIRAFGHGVVMRRDPWDTPEDVCRFYVRTVTDNIDAFLEGRRCMTMWLDEIGSEFPSFLDRLDATGDLDGAVAEWGTRHNASR